MFFSIVIYANVDRELSRFENFQELSKDRVIQNFGYLPNSDISSIVDQQLIDEARGRLVSDLFLLNTCILIAAGVSGYFLAGRTLAPIKAIIEDQARFIGDASHELKTPLTALRSEIEIYLMSKKKTLQESDEILRSNLEEVIRLQTITDSLMKLATLEKGSGSFQFEKVRLEEIFNDAGKAAASFSKEKKITIVQKKTNIKAAVNKSSLTQLLTILLDNAIKYSKPGTRVTLSAKRIKKEVVIRVTDQGIGIPQNELTKIFERFYRVDKSRSSKGISGYGLGLSIAKEIVSLHKGSIEATSNKKGSTFLITLPKS